MKQERIQKQIFWCVVFASFVAIAIYNFITPYFADDFGYARAAVSATSLWDIILQEYHEYMTWNGRSVVHFLLRIFFRMPPVIFHLANSAVFVGLSLLMYYHLDFRKKYDIGLYLLVHIFLWRYAISFAQTVLWKTGACNYLWGTAITLSMVTLFRHCCKKGDTIKNEKGTAVALFLLGILGGWCNENTSGGGILLVLFFTFLYWQEHRKVKIFQITGIIGMFVGFGMMALAPGNALRAAAMAEERNFFVQMAARFMKCTLVIKDYYLELLLLFVIFFLIAWAQTADKKRLIPIVGFFVVFLATAYSLILAPTQMPRAFFGAGIFLMIGALQCLDVAECRDKYFVAGKQCFVAVLLIVMSFTYLEEGANLARVYRESMEREAHIQSERAKGESEVTVAMLSEEFFTKYTMGYDVDVEESAGYWINIGLAEYFGVDKINGMQRQEWEEKVRDK